MKLKLNKFSAFARAESHLVQKTTHGAIGLVPCTTFRSMCDNVYECDAFHALYAKSGTDHVLAAVTLCGVILALILFGAELREHFSVSHHQEVMGLSPTWSVDEDVVWQTYSFLACR